MTLSLSNQTSQELHYFQIYLLSIAQIPKIVATSIPRDASQQRQQLITHSFAPWTTTWFTPKHDKLAMGICVEDLQEAESKRAKAAVSNEDSKQ